MLPPASSRKCVHILRFCLFILFCILWLRKINPLYSLFSFALCGLGHALCVYMCVGLGVLSSHACGGQRIVCGNLFSPSSVCVPEIEPTLSDLGSSTFFTHWVISPQPSKIYVICVYECFVYCTSAPYACLACRGLKKKHWIPLELESQMGVRATNVGAENRAKTSGRTLSALNLWASLSLFWDKDLPYH